MPYPISLLTTTAIPDFWGSCISAADQLMTFLEKHNINLPPWVDNLIVFLIIAAPICIVLWKMGERLFSPLPKLLRNAFRDVFRFLGFAYRYVHTPSNNPDEDTMRGLLLCVAPVTLIAFLLCFFMNLIHAIIGAFIILVLCLSIKANYEYYHPKPPTIQPPPAQTPETPESADNEHQDNTERSNGHDQESQNH